MNMDTLKSWVRKKKAEGFAQNVALGLLALGVGLVILFITFWFTYAVILVGWLGVSAFSDLVFGREMELTHEMRLACSGLFLVLLVIQHFRTDPSYWEQYRDQDYVAAPALAHQGGVIGGLGFMLAYPGGSANLAAAHQAAALLLSGPRLVDGAFKLITQGIYFRRLDENGCAELLAFLHSRREAVPYDELKSAGWEEWFGQLRCFDGVHFLQKGLVLSEELRGELNRLKVD
jgi:hypothetical protein